MLTYCLKCKKDTENVNWKVLKTTNGRKMLLSKCNVCSSKKSRFMEEEEAKGLLSSLDLKTQLSKIPLLGDIFLNAILLNSCYQYKLNEMWDKFMPEMHLKQPGFTDSACGPSTKNKEISQTFMQTGNTNYIYRNDLDKGCFQNDLAYGKYKNLTKRTQSKKIFWEIKLLKLQAVQNMMDIKEDQLQ